MKNNSTEDRCFYLRVLLCEFKIFSQWKFIDSNEKAQKLFQQQPRKSCINALKTLNQIQLLRTRLWNTERISRNTIRQECAGWLLNI